jgi:hypothetical protein
LKKGTRLSKFEKKCDECFFLGYSTTSKTYRVWNLTSGALEEVYDVEFDETNGFQEQDENLDNVRGTQLVNAMKYMDIGDIRPREVINVEPLSGKTKIGAFTNFAFRVQISRQI